MDVWQELPVALGDKISFHTFIYNSTDIEKYKSSEFAAGLPFVLEAKLGTGLLYAFSESAMASSISLPAAFLDGSLFLQQRSDVPEFLATTVSLTPACILAPGWRCLTRCDCGSWSAPCFWD